MVLTVYIVECADGSYYTGITNNIEKRLTEHNQGVSARSYTYTRRPVILVYHEDHSDPLYAIRREKQIKRWSRRKKIAMIEGRWEDLPGLSRSSN